MKRWQWRKQALLAFYGLRFGHGSFIYWLFWVRSVNSPNILHLVHRHLSSSRKSNPSWPNPEFHVEAQCSRNCFEWGVVAEGAYAVVGSFFNGLSIPNNAKFDLYKHKRSDEYYSWWNRHLRLYRRVWGDPEWTDYIVGLYDPVKKNAVQLYRCHWLWGRVTARSKRSRPKDLELSW